MKTAMQELIEQMHPNFFTDQEKGYLLDKEKQQIIDAAKHGANFDKSPFANAEDYYNQTYNNDEAK